MTKDGQTVPTANIPMGGFKLTGLGAGTSATDAAQFGQLQNAPVATLITVSGADTITGTLVQTLTAYATGQQFSFVAAGTNTTAVTLNIDGLGAKAVTRTGAVALDAGALVSGQMAIVEYDGTRFQLINANAFTNLTVSGALTVGTTLAVTGVATLNAQPILSSLTASLPVFSDASKGLVSNAMTGTGSVMMSASPTTTGTLTAAAINASGLVAMAGAATVGTTLGVTGTSTMAAINASGLVAMAGAATVGTTLGVTGTSTLSGTVLTGYTLGVGEAGANDALLRLGPTALSANYSSRLNFAASNSVTNWQISANTAASGAGGFAITPSTAGGGTTFSTAALSITSAGAVTIPGTLDVSTGTGNIGWGTYTPTLTNTTNVGAATAYLATYMRVGNTVTVAGQIDLDPTALGATELGISLPVASNFTTTLEMGGTAAALGVTEVFGLSADATNDRAKMSGLAVSSANHQVAYHFTYQVK